MMAVDNILGGLAVLLGAAALVFMVYLTYKTYKIKYYKLIAIFAIMTFFYTVAYTFAILSYIKNFGA